MAEQLSSMNISLPVSLRTFVRERMEMGGYANASECIRHLIRLDREQFEQGLADLIQEGLNSGPPVVTDDKFWSDMDRRVEKRARELRRGERKASKARHGAV